METAKLLEISDPFSLLLERLDEHVQSHPGLADRVRVWASAVDDIDELKTKHSSDVPWFSFEPDGLPQFVTAATSNYAEVMFSVGVFLLTEGGNLKRQALPTMWELTKALLNLYQDGRVLGLPYVVRYSLEPATFSIVEEESRAPFPTMVGRVVFLLRFDRSLLT